MLVREVAARLLTLGFQVAIVADESLVDRDDFVTQTERREVAVVHRFANVVRQKASGSARNL